MKLTNNLKDYILRVRMEKSTLDKLDHICDIGCKNCFKIIRYNIEYLK